MKEMKTEKFKTKDYVLIGIITAIYSVLNFIVGAASSIFVIANAFAPAFTGLLFGGTITLFLIKQIPKFGVLSLFSLILMLILTILGMGYLPWFLSTMLGAILGDIIAVTSQYQNKLKNAFAYGIMQLGFVSGGIIPVWFFADSYRQTWLGKGMDISTIEESIQLYTGLLGSVILLASFLGGFLGIYIAYKILDKHFKERE